MQDAALSILTRMATTNITVIIYHGNAFNEVSAGDAWCLCVLSKFRHEHNSNFKLQVGLDFTLIDAAIIKYLRSGALQLGEAVTADSCVLWHLLRL
jgi:hypothetical protein